jgi:hypothetical protein
MRIALVAASLVLVVSGAAGCGGGGSGGSSGSSAPKDASKTSFCNGFEAFAKNTESVGKGSSTKADIAKAKSETAKLQKIGTPKGIPSDARKGFEAFIDTVRKIPDDASSSDLQNFTGKFSSTQEKEFEAFITYVGTECPDIGN